MKDPRIIGDAKRGEIEVRFDEPAHLTLDEIVAFHAFIHLEKMSDQEYALIVETRTQRACFYIGALKGKAWVNASVSWREQINRRSEGQKRRHNARKAAGLKHRTRPRV